MNKQSFPKKVIKPMQDYLVNFQKLLRKRSQQLKKEDPFFDSDRVNDNASSDADASEISGHDRITALRQDISSRLVIVRKALTKIKLGKYGLCDHCGKMIDTDRLQINPTAELCIACEKKKEE